MITHGSLMVVHSLTRPSSRLTTAAAYSANQCGDVGIEPAAQVVQGRGKIPVVQRHHRLDGVLEQRVDEALVEVQPRAGSPGLVRAA